MAWVSDIYAAYWAESGTEDRKNMQKAGDRSDRRHSE
ncbi:hypothetical protein SKA58_15467 [Sphingomonas sp. SKA58]|nr:hypothetical protein SKA58_15467 [Sphingomonas sp. SKA58]